MKQIPINEYVNILNEHKGNKENRNFSARRKGIVIFQVTTECNFRCSYCYECNKFASVTSVDEANRQCNEIIRLLQLPDGVLGYQNIDGLDIQFIGGEPFLAVDIMSYIIDTLIDKIYDVRPEILPFVMINITTNGSLLLTKKVKEFIEKYYSILFITTSIDGIKELQDRNRKTITGQGTFDRVFEGLKYLKSIGLDNIKSTFPKEDIKYMFDSFKLLADNGFTRIMMTGIYEDKYDAKDAKELYYQLKLISDYIIDNKLDLWYNLLYEQIGINVKYTNYSCESCGDQICFSPDGKAYCCARFAPTSLGDKAEELSIGDSTNGVFCGDKEKMYKYLKSVTAESQSSEKCINCPINFGCGWCNAQCFQENGTIEKRTTGNCLFHHGRVLAYWYFKNKKAIMNNAKEVYKCPLDDKIILEILPKEELKLLRSMEDQLIKSIDF